MTHRTLTRFLKYSLVGGGTFSLDLLLLYILIDLFSVQYIIASGLAFIIAVSINYILSRKYIFKGTLRSVEDGYRNFLLIACIGLSVVISSMYVLVTIMGAHYLTSRIIVALITGFWNYLMNLFVNFKVAGRHE